MSLALKIEGNYSGFIYFDAVTQYTRNFSGQLTSHPIGSGGLITDHFIRDNPKYTFTGVVSAADISVGTGSITDGSGKRPTNVRGDIPSVNIKGNNRTLISLVPQTISQFFVDAQSSVSIGKDSRTKVLQEVRGVLESLFRQDGITTVKLLEYENMRTKPNIISDLVVTSISFDESPDTGQALYVNISLEKATFTTVQTRKLTAKELALLSSSKVSDSNLKPVVEAKTDVGSNPVKPDNQTAAHKVLYGDKSQQKPPITDALMKQILLHNAGNK